MIENSQRDLNIAFMNELSGIFQALGIDTGDVLAAARTKWNFLPFTPASSAATASASTPTTHLSRAEGGPPPEVILAGRRTNDEVGARIARETVRLMLKAGRREPRVVVLGLTFKENVPDIRNSRVVDIIARARALRRRRRRGRPARSGRRGPPRIRDHAVGPAPVPGGYDAVVLAVAHETYRAAAGRWSGACSSRARAS